MALVPVLNIGVGLLVLIILWAVTMIAVVALAAVPKARYAIPVVLLLSLAITLVLIFYPRASADEQVSITRQDTDEVYYGRLVLLLMMSLFLAGGGVIMFVLQCIEPIYAGPRRQYYITS